MSSEKPKTDELYSQRNSKTYQSPSQLLTQRPPQPIKEKSEKKKDN